MLPEEIEKLQALREQGALSDEEFEAAKGQLLKADRTGKSDKLLGLDLNNYRALMHGSQFAGFIIPFGGLIAPIVLWQMAREEYPEVDVEGKYIMNWLISEFIYLFISAVLCLVLIGIPLLIFVLIASMILPLIALVKATQGESYDYPMAIKFLK